VNGLSDVHVQVRVGSERYALPIASVREVAELHTLATVPGAGSAVLGVLNLHGQVVPVFDFAAVVGTAREGRPSRIVVAEQRGTLAGLAVDEVIDVGTVAPEREDAGLEILESAVLEDGRLVGIVDVERMFASLAHEAS
jgi:purine-binding chemotaxis protein CheW